MVSVITQRKRRTLIKNNLLETCSALGFEYLDGNNFIREKRGIQDIFFYQQSRSLNQFVIQYGCDCTELLLPIREEKQHGLFISTERLGRGRKNFGCKYEEHIVNSSREVAQLLETEAGVWFQQFKEPYDIAEYYREFTVRSNNPGDIINSYQANVRAQYGVMLLSMEDTRGYDWLSPVLKFYRATDKLSPYAAFQLSVIDSLLDE